MGGTYIARCQEAIVAVHNPTIIKHNIPTITKLADPISISVVKSMLSILRLAIAGDSNKVTACQLDGSAASLLSCKR